MATGFAVDYLLSDGVTRQLLAGLTSGNLGTIFVGTNPVQSFPGANTITWLRVAPSSATVQLGTTQQYTATATYGNNTTADVTTQVTWSTSPTSVATINSGGLLTGVGLGTASVQAKSSNGIIGTTAVSVFTKQVTSVAIQPLTQTLSLSLGPTSVQYTATATYQDCSTANVTAIATWTSTPSSVATISSTGMATAVADGTATITATSDGVTSNGATITVVSTSQVTGVTATCAPTTIQTGQFSACTGSVAGTGSVSPNVTWTASAGTINPITGVYSNTTPGTYTITATSQQDTTKTATVSVTVVNGANNTLAIVVDGGPSGLTSKYDNGAFATIDHVLVDTGSVGVRLLAKAAGGELDPSIVPLPQQTSSGSVIAQCNQFIDGFTWGSVSLATVQLTQPSGGLAGETASTPPNATVAGLPVQLIGDPNIPTVPSSCSSTGTDESNFQALGANGVLGVGTFQQDCGPGCVSGSSAPNVYYACASGSCSETFQGLAQQVSNPVWVLPADNNGVLVQLPSVPTGGTTTVSGNMIIGIGTQTNNGLGSATVFDTDANAYFVTIFNGQTNSCSYIDSGSNALFFPSAGYPGLIVCGNPNSSFYCPTNLLTLSANNQSAANTNGASGTASFSVGNANTLFNNNNWNNVAFMELAGPNSPISGCGSSFDWGLSFFYGRNVFTGIEQQPVTGTSYVGPFWAY